MQQYKIIFSGPVGAGKSTAIRMLSDIDVVSTEARASDQTKELKDQTTVAMDYGRINLDEKTAVHLYGTPGQERFSFMWEILARGALGLVLLIDASNEGYKQDVDTYLNAFSEFTQQNPVVIGLTHTDKASESAWEAIQMLLTQRSLSAPIFEVDARNKDDINMLVQALIYSIDPTVS